MAFQDEKSRFGLWIKDETREKVEQHYKVVGCDSMSEFIEKAIDFYCGFLTAENYKEYFPDVIVSTIKGTLDSLEDRMAKLLFKLAVEQSLMMHIVAGTNDVDEDSLNALRGKCVRDCKSINGVISFEDAVKYQYGEDD